MFQSRTVQHPISNKTLIVNYFICENSLDFLCLTETWHREGGKKPVKQSCSPGLHVHWSGTYRWPQGRSSLKITLLPLSDLHVVWVHCIPPQPQYPSHVLHPDNISFINSWLFWTVYFTLPVSTQDVDFNICVDNPQWPLVVYFCNLLDCLNLEQHVDVSSHPQPCPCIRSCHHIQACHLWPHCALNGVLQNTKLWNGLVHPKSSPQNGKTSGPSTRKSSPGVR